MNRGDARCPCCGEEVVSIARPRTGRPPPSRLSRPGDPECEAERPAPPSRSASPLLYLGYLRLFKWDQNQQWLPYLGLWVISFVVWRVLAATALAERLGEAFIPGLLIVLSCASRWVLLTVFAVALAQRPKVRRTLQKEIADCQANAEARALGAEQAAANTALTASTNQSTST